MKSLLFVCAIAASPCMAATYHQNDTWVGQLTGTHTLTFSSPFATPCGGGDWSGCSYQAGGQILAVDDPSKCGGWCGTTIGSFYIDAYQNISSLSFDFTEWSEKSIIVHFTGQNPVNFDLASNQPAPVPLPAGLPLLAAGLASFSVIRKKRKAIAYVN